MIDGFSRRDVVIGGSAAFALNGLSTQLARADEPKTLTVAWDTDIDTLDPAAYKSIAAFTTVANIYDSPLFWKVQPVAEQPGVMLARPGDYEGGIAESWAFEKDGATLVMKIRPGLTFPSGRAVNAAAVKYLFDRNLQSPGYMARLFPVLVHVSKPEQFEVRDDMTFAMNMGAPSPMALDVVCLLNNALVDPDEVKAHATDKDPWASDWIKRNATGLGAYRLVRNEPGVEVVIEATPNYWRGKPTFERIVLKYVPNEADRVLLLRRGAIDLVVGRAGLTPRNVKSFEGDKKFKIVSLPDTTCHFLCMNNKKAPFDNVKVRQAVNYAIPIEAILPSVLYGYGAQMKSPVASLTPGYDETLSPYKHDIDKAQALIKESGLKGPIEVDLAARVGWQTHEQAAVWIQRELEKLGFKINIVRETDATFRQIANKGDHVLSIESWQSWVNDPFYHLSFNFHSKSRNTNVAGYMNPTVDKLIDDNMHEPDKAKRLAAARELQKILIDDAAWGFLWYENWTRVTRADLSGIGKRWDSFERYHELTLAAT
ncbi:MAG: ABC transporter substrate-binding protein [Methylobacteriaceae bacterium]|nr:ABC transporter substrate-binding protein [Methylobacteriaceae bacterium]